MVIKLKHADRKKIDKLIKNGMHPMQAAQEVTTIEIMPDVRVERDSVSWFVSRMFNPEDNIWVWIRRIANILTFPILIMILAGYFI